VIVRVLSMFLVGILVCWMPTNKLCRGRAQESWTYQKLLRDSDLVLIAQPLETKVSVDAFPDPEWNEKLQSRVTRFRVLVVFKGNYDKEDISILHYDLKPGLAVNNGPRFATFRLKEVTLSSPHSKGSTSKPEYLLFLRKKKDSGFVFTSGQLDSRLSVREMYEKLPTD